MPWCCWKACRISLRYALPLLVPQVDADGNEIAGIRLPEVAVPLGTYTGWNFMAVDHGSLAPLAGSYIPFARNPEERKRNSDPRPSVEVRYSSKAEYLSLVEEEAKKLTARHFLLADDLDAMIGRAGEHWDLIVGEQQ